MDPKETAYTLAFQKLLSLTILDVLGVLFQLRRALFVLSSSQINMLFHIPLQCNEHGLGLLLHQHLWNQWNDSNMND